MQTIKVFLEDVTSSNGWNTASIVSLIGIIITFIISVSTLLSNRKWRKKDIDANLKAKARIEWITDVRENTGKYLSLLSLLRNLTITINYKLSQIDRMAQLNHAKDNDKNHLQIAINELEREYSVFYSEVEKIEVDIIAYSERLLLYFSEQPDHTKIIAEISEPKSIVVIVKDGVRNKDRETLNTTNIRLANSIQNIRSCLRDYLKIEWDRAKNGE